MEVHDDYMYYAQENQLLHIAYVHVENAIDITCVHLHVRRFVYSHVAGRYRRREILDHFEDSDRDAGSTGDCCDVCISSKEDECEAEPEMMIVVEISQAFLEKLRFVQNILAKHII